MPSFKTQIILWSTALGFWVTFSIRYHPTLRIDVFVTLILLSSYAAMIYFNYLQLIPKLFHKEKYFSYWSALIFSMMILTLTALFVIRLIYTILWNPEELGEFWQHYGIDLFGMAIHSFFAMVVVWIAQRVKRERNNPFPAGEKFE